MNVAMSDRPFATSPPDTGPLADAALARAGLIALVIGAVCFVICAATAFFTPLHFFPAYLMAFVLWFGVSAGCLAILMLHNLVGGRWGWAIRPLAECGAHGIGLMGLLFVPLLFGLHVNYPWARPAEVEGDAVLTHQAKWMNPTRFTLFSIGYFVVLGLLAALLGRRRLTGDQAPLDHRGIELRAKAISGPGMLIYGVVVSLAAIDWVMSLEPRWYSTIFGLLFIVGQGLSAFAVLTMALWALSRWVAAANLTPPERPGPLEPGRAPPTAAEARAGVRVVASDFQDLGNLLLTFTILWAYMAFSQFLIIWSGNLPDEAVYYVPRLREGWEYIALGLVVLHWGLPFAALLSRALKRRGGWLATLAVFILVMRQVDLFWVIFPSTGKRGGVSPTLWHSLTNFANYLAPLGIGGLWVAFFIWQLRSLIRRGVPLLPDPPPATRHGGSHADGAPAPEGPRWSVANGGGR